MLNNQTKRFVIVLIYLVIFSVLALLIYLAVKPEETCFDGRKNQNEEDADCGGVCAACRKIEAQPLLTKETGAVPSGASGEYDAYGIVANPNNVFGSSKFQYEMILKDASGGVLAQREGTSFILPGEKKYIVENNLKSEAAPANIEFRIKSPEWVEFKDYYAKPELEIVNKNYSQITSGVGFSEAKGLLKNKSPYDFNIIKIRIILKDSAGKVVALNSTEMRTVKSGEERDFRAFWPNRFPGDVQSMETQIEVNIFDMQAFIKR